MVEHLTFNQGVPGSIPGRPTNRVSGLRPVVQWRPVSVCNELQPEEQRVDRDITPERAEALWRMLREEFVTAAAVRQLATDTD